MESGPNRHPAAATGIPVPFGRIHTLLLMQAVENFLGMVQLARPAATECRRSRADRFDPSIDAPRRRTC
jgi:hypothetical protein